MAAIGFGYAGMSALAAYKLAEKNGDKGVEAYGKQKGIQRELNYFREKILTVQSTDELFKDRRLTAFILTATDLGSEIRYPGRVKKMLTEKRLDENAWMNKLVDKRWREAADILQLGERGVIKIKTRDVIEDLADRYVKNQYERRLERQSPAVTLARNFKEKAATIKNAYEILGDEKLRKFVTDALGLPPQIALQPVESQAALIERRINIKDLKDKTYVDKMVQRYLVMEDQKTQSETGGGSSWLLNLFA